ncbi:MAG TPA: threonine/serine exporter family protein [Clostridia bacterium]|nr:threonine/serine exporter family protein [Clostridia bacterium]
MQSGCGLSPQSREVLRVLELAGLLILQNGGETYRVEETVQRMGEGFGYADTRVVCMQTGFFISLGVDGDYQTLVRRVQRRSTNLWRVDEVNRISRCVVQGTLNPAQTLEALQKIACLPPLPVWLSTTLSGLAAGGFALMLGADAGAFAAAAVSGAVIQLLAVALDRLELYLVLTHLLAGFACAILVSMAHRWFGVSMEPAIAGALMPLLPGVAMTNAVRDTIRGDLLAGVTRGVEALLVAVLLAAGVVVGLWLGKA